MRLPSSLGQLAHAGNVRAVAAYKAGLLCGQRGEPVRLARDVVRAIKYKHHGRISRGVVLAFWGGWRQGRAHHG
ncbi:MAG TPA: hypothetical protein VGR74_12100 [Actinomycetota bacterium]|nr:hypothetical protein [Actinomycetota bacterium]